MRPAIYEAHHRGTSGRYHRWKINQRRVQSSVVDVLRWRHLTPGQDIKSRNCDAVVAPWRCRLPYGLFGTGRGAITATLAADSENRRNMNWRKHWIDFDAGQLITVNPMPQCWKNLSTIVGLPTLINLQRHNDFANRLQQHNAQIQNSLVIKQRSCWLVASLLLLSLSRGRVLAGPGAWCHRFQLVSQRYNR